MPVYKKSANKGVKPKNKKTKARADAMIASMDDLDTPESYYKLFSLPEVKSGALQIKKREIENPDISMLKTGQKIVFDGLTAFLRKSGGGMAILDAPAGTGKSFVMAKVIEHALYHHKLGTYRKLEKDCVVYRSGYSTAKKSIGCTATTNKAVKITYRMADYFHPQLDYFTIHKMLGLRESISKDGKQIFIQDTQNPPNLDGYAAVILDEWSMLSDELFLGNDKVKGIVQYVEEGLKVIFVGDSRQIPPVGQLESCLCREDIREKYDIEYYTMTEPIRQALDNPIIELCTNVRHNFTSRGNFGGYSKLWEGDKGIYSIDRSTDAGMEFFESLLEHIFTSENFSVDPDFGKVVVYRNKLVDSVNKVIRKLIYKDVENLGRIAVGEKLIANNPIFEGENIILPTNEELEVIEFTEKWEFSEIVTDVELPFYDTRVKYYRFDNSEAFKRIKILTTEGLVIYKGLLDQLTKVAVSLEKGSTAAYLAWKNKFAFERSYADVNYNYALTCYKAQGSTYKNVIVFECDLNKQFVISTRNRMKYTSFSRPSERLFII